MFHHKSVLSIRGAFLCVAAIVVPAACASKSATPLPANDAPLWSSASDAQASPHDGTTLTIALPPIQPANVPYIGPTPSPQRLSPATASISGTIEKRKFGPIALGDGTAACASPSPGEPLLCSVVISAPVGNNVSLQMSTFAKAGGTPLAILSQRVVILRGANYLTVAMPGLAQRIATRLIPGALTQGQYANVDLVVFGVDAAGKPIPGPISNSAAVSVQLSGIVTANYSNLCEYGSCSPIYCCGTIGSFVYDGLATGTESARTTSTISYNPSKISVTIKPGNTQLATLLAGADVNLGAGSYETYGYTNVQFVPGTSGNSPPARAVLVQYPLYGEDSQGNYWAASTHYSNVGAVLGTVKLKNSPRPFATDAQGHIYGFTQSCGFSEYPAHRYGSLKPIRTVTCSGTPGGLPVVDDAGNVYLTFESSGGVAKILEYAANGGSGNVPPIRTIATQDGSYATYEPLAVDGAGNLYAELGGETTSGVFEFAPGATIGKQILTNVAVSGFTVDRPGNVYAVVPTAPGGPKAIEMFAPGSTTPSAIITGPNTQVTANTYQLVVPR